jgi:predicted acylesterase/phospholipase RssA
VGVLKALRKRKVEPEVYCGTSVGSFNCAMAVSGRTLEEMEDVWVSLTHSRVFKLRFDLKQLLTFDPRPPLRFAVESAKILGGILNDSIRTGMSWWQLIDLDSILVDTSPLADLIRKNVVLDALHRSDKEICIALTRLKPVDSDPLVFVRKKQISHDHILASCSLPLIFPQVNIGAHTYCDGGVVMNSPLKPAIDAQADEIYVVDLTPPPRTYERATLPLAYQVLSAGFSSALRRDIESAHELNRMYLAAHMQGQLVQDKLEISKMDTTPGTEPEISTRHYRYLRIYVIRPDPDPKGIAGFLDFDPQNAKALIQQGEEEAEMTLSRHYEKEMVGPSGKKKMALFSQ